MLSQDLSIRTLLKAGVHFGHVKSVRHPEMMPYLHTLHNGMNIIDLSKTLPLLKTALEEMRHVALRGGNILFVATKRQASKLVVQFAQDCNMPYVHYRWLGGMLTNYKTIKRSTKHLHSLNKLCEDTKKMAQLTKKERLNLNRKLLKLENSLGGIKDMPGLPDMVFIIDVGRERITVQEANRLKIPVIGVVDTNCSPAGVDFVIPGNDDAMSAIELYLSLAANTIKAAREERKTRNLVQHDAKYNSEVTVTTVIGDHNEHSG
jgi:small subunit ribosomal protein S2